MNRYLLILTIIIITTINNFAVTMIVANNNDSGAGSLRDAVTSSSSGDIIDMTGLTGTISLTSGQIDITSGQNISIVGPGYDNLTIDCNNNSRAFYIYDADVVIESITIINGLVSDGGGAIRAVFGSDLTVSFCWIDNCHTNTGYESRGGAIQVVAYDPSTWVENGSVTVLLQHTQIENCTAYIGGGAMFTAYTLALTIDINNCTFKDNTTGAFGDLYSGNDGGAIEIVSFNPPVSNFSIVNSTFSGNSTQGPTYSSVGGALSLGGGIYDINSCTFTNNTSITEGGGISFWGSGSCTLTNTIVAQNTATNTGNDLDGTILSGGYNLIGNTDGSAFTSSTGDITGTTALPINALLFGIAANGGIAETHAIDCNSPAIDVGGNCPTADERDSLRNVCPPDIGAFEYQTPCCIVFSDTVYICSGDSVFTDGLWQSTTGIYGDTIVITNTSPIPTITGLLEYCTGSSTTLDAGSGYNSYDWSTTEISQTINVTSSGNYSVTVSDENGCTGIDNVTVIENHLPVVSLGADAFMCDVTSYLLDAGNPGSTFSWNPSISPSTQTNLITSTGTYSVTVTGENGCLSSSSISICFGYVALVEESTNVSCYGESNGSIDIEVQNGQAPYSYIWDNDAVTEDLNNIPAGTYSVIVTDSIGCTATETVTIVEPLEITVSVIANNISCFGESDGEVSAIATGGNGGYIYNWNSGAFTGANIQNLYTNTYSLVVTDVLGCTATASVILTEPSEIVTSFTTEDIDCYGDNTGSINLDVTGGNPNYSYQWSNNHTSQDLNNLIEGLYTVVVTDAIGCTKYVECEIFSSSELTTAITNDFFICENTEETIVVSTTGGVSPYSYIWSTNEITESINVSPNVVTTYTVTITDDKNCNTTNEVTVSVYPQLEIQSFSNVDTVCPGDPVLISSSYYGGSGPPYVLLIDGVISSVPFIVYPTNEETYNITIQDQCNNQANSFITLYNYNSPQVSIIPDVLKGCSPLKVKFNGSTNCNNCTYTWDFDETNQNNLSFNNNPVHIFEDAGTYSITSTVSDNNGCTSSVFIPNMITVYPTPEARFVADPEVANIIEPVIYFKNQSDGASFYTWDFGDGKYSSSEDSDHLYNQIGNYTVELVAISEFSCRDTVSDYVTIEDIFTFYAPTAFSPDNDGLNDYFKIKGHGIQLDDFTLYIYDRWGEVIFQTNDIYEGWDGTVYKSNNIVQNGTYTWLAIVYDYNGIQRQKAGKVTVIR